MIREKEKCNIENCLRFREKSAMILNAQSLSTRQEHRAVFSVCQVLFHTIYNEPVAEDMEHYALSSAFCVC